MFNNLPYLSYFGLAAEQSDSGLGFGTGHLGSVLPPTRSWDLREVM